MLHVMRVLTGGRTHCPSWQHIPLTPTSTQICRTYHQHLQATHTMATRLVSSKVKKVPDLS